MASCSRSKELQRRRRWVRDSLTQVLYSGVVGGKAATKELGDYVHVGKVAGFDDCEVEVAVQVGHPLNHLFDHFQRSVYKPVISYTRFAGFTVGVNSDKSWVYGGLALLIGREGGSSLPIWNSGPSWGVSDF
ncbi:hypothetical protein C1H46_034400 [Malus baccata]|uniref:Uncharacterized protein n=1 Tax=Malus baccata TaxID=106549 RepID=A0A540L0L0_MALBA|nr:hypothetical protein C1H46_034400 [Malus baccata]